jgi:hypothetical protein
MALQSVLGTSLGLELLLGAAVVLESVDSVLDQLASVLYNFQLGLVPRSRLLGVSEQRGIEEDLFLRVRRGLAGGLEKGIPGFGGNIPGCG